MHMSELVGIVLVSHSERLASGLRDLVAELLGASSPPAVAGGTEDGGIGTSDTLIRAAIAQADSGRGVVLLPDIGSAVLTARIVLDDDPRPDVVLVDAPFVEGAVAAAVTASSGADLDTVVQAAKDARSAVKF
ncbi:dihydroxyacetone kinase phosphotransfer subunit [Murinocardiopsis flavida]|uniref:phosphoenolpyruvate--glycerone phosphotransferase n=2 Tax=Murinocardiopsis flavida TaxID=645275 RepID=A0A2P8D532_9ACTN|nr:dihydroxyacetone kinase phosphotransfer subunit [Murinocardiopsis flavida]